LSALDRPVWASLSGAHADLAQGAGPIPDLPGLTAVVRRPGIQMVHAGAMPPAE
jgi:hypothetical protein